MVLDVHNLMEVGQQQLGRIPSRPRMEVGRRQLALDVCLVGIRILADLLLSQDVRRLRREVAALIALDLLQLTCLVDVAVYRPLVAADLDE